MRAVQIDRYGSVDAVGVREVSRPDPAPGEVLVRIRAASVNDWEYGLLRGLPLVTRPMVGFFKPRRPLILGCDMAGTVEAVGAGVETLVPGDDVFGDLCMHGFGAFADYCCAPERILAKKPPGMSFDQAAALPQAGGLAVQGLFDAGRVQARKSLLINGAGGGVGTLALQMLEPGAMEVTVVDSAKKLDKLRELGADHVIDYAREDFTGSGRRYDLILDTKTLRSPFALTRSLHENGVYVTVGGSMARIAQGLAAAPLISTLRSRRYRVVALKANRDLPYLIDRFERGKLEPVLDQIYELESIADALRRFAAAEHIGKIIISVSR